MASSLRANKGNDDLAALGSSLPSSSSLEYTPLPSIAPLVASARETYSTYITHPYEFRIQQLRGIERLVRENSDELSAAIQKDLGQGPMFCEAFDLSHVVSRTRYAQSQLRGWMAARRERTPFPVNLYLPIHSNVTPNPRGVALLMIPWNMPVQLTLNPLTEALAAGNVCVLKMSERSVHCTKLLTKLLTGGEYVDPRVVRVVNGGAEEATELLKQRFDVISYTGGEQVGRIVAQAAARHLTPVLLELGGKNPVFVTKNAHIPLAAFRVAWGRITANTGQACISPDYVLVEESVKKEFVDELCKAMDRMYPVSSYSNTSGERGDLGKMISVEHAQRVVDLVDSTCEVIYGGRHHNVKERFVAPTIVEATADSTVMRDETFGPVLAIIPVPNLEGAIRFVNEHFTSKAAHPLVMYIFSRSKKEQRRIMSCVPSGSCAINETIKQVANYHLPFGGVGASGMGAYNGRHGFRFFSHYRGTMTSGNTSTYRWDPSVWLITPPFNNWKLLTFRLMGKVHLLVDKLKSIIPVAKAVIPIALASACFRNPNILDALLELNLKTVLNWISQRI